MLQRPASLGERFGTYLFPQAAPGRAAPGPLCAVQIPTDLRDRPPRAADQRDRLGLELLAEPSARSVLWLYVDTFPEGAPLIIGVRRTGSRPGTVSGLDVATPREVDSFELRVRGIAGTVNPPSRMATTWLADAVV
jgi:hypothetical protein